MAIEGVVESSEQAGPIGPEFPLGGEVPHGVARDAEVGRVVVVGEVVVHEGAQPRHLYSTTQAVNEAGAQDVVRGILRGESLERAGDIFRIQPRHVAVHAQGTPSLAYFGAMQTVGQSHEVQLSRGIHALIHRTTDIFIARDPSRGHGTKTVIVIDAEDTQVVVPEIARTPPHAGFGRPSMPRLQGAADGGVVTQRNSIAIGLGLVALAQVGIELGGWAEGVRHTQRTQRHRVEAAVPQEGRGGLVEVQRLTNRLVDILYPESRSDAQATETENVLGENTPGGCLALRALPGRARLGSSAGSAIELVGSIRRIRGHTTDQRVVLVPRLPLVAHPRLGPERGVAVSVDGVGIDQVGRVAEGTAP